MRHLPQQGGGWQHHW